MIGALQQLELVSLVGSRSLRARFPHSGLLSLVGEHGGYRLAPVVGQHEWCLAIFLRRSRGMLMMTFSSVVAHEVQKERQVIVKNGEIIVIGLERFRITWKRGWW